MTLEDLGSGHTELVYRQPIAAADLDQARLLTEPMMDLLAARVMP